MAVVAIVGPNGPARPACCIGGWLAEPTPPGSSAAASRSSRLVPAHPRRRVALLTQRSTLFPHLTCWRTWPSVLAPPDWSIRVWLRALTELEAVGCASSRPSSTGTVRGQAQRVAIARLGDRSGGVAGRPLAGLDVSVAAECGTPLPPGSVDDGVAITQT